MKKILGHILLLLFCCVPQVTASPRAFVTIPPQKYFVDHISGGQIPVSIMVLPGASPHTYEPKPKQMAQLAAASLYFTIGDSFDLIWMERIQAINPKMTIVRTEANITKIPITDHHETHAHHLEPESLSEHDHHEVEHSLLDPHIWLDPNLVKIQAQHICTGLMMADPQNVQQYQQNLEKFEQQLTALDQEIQDTLAVIPAEKRSFLVFHPSWGYFAKAYGLQQQAVEVQGKEPSPRELSQIIAQAQALDTKVIFVQPQFSQKSAEVIAQQIGATTVHLDPLAEDWANNLRHAAQALVQALQ